MCCSIGQVSWRSCSLEAFDSVSSVSSVVRVKKTTEDTEDTESSSALPTEMVIVWARLVFPSIFESAGCNRLLRVLSVLRG